MSKGNELFNHANLEEELKHAVRFLHNHGTLLHYEDPLLNNLFFVDFQWLYDLLGRIIKIKIPTRDGKLLIFT